MSKTTDFNTEGLDLNEECFSEALQNGWWKLAIKCIEAGVNPNVRGKGKVTPLHYACEKELALLLISKGADINANDTAKATPLH